MISSKNYVDILGFNVFSGPKDVCIGEIFSVKHKIHIVSGNPEVLHSINDNLYLRKNIQPSNSIIIPDGVGTKLAAKITRKNIFEKIAGIDVMMDIIDRCEKDAKSIFLLGSTKESLLACKSSLEKKYPHLNIAGYADGYYDESRLNVILNEIKDVKPYAIFVALGCPKQEEFIVKHMDELPCKIYMGVGGSFDVIGGVKKRAPKIMIKLGLEWLYRVYKEPFRVKRLQVIPKFMYKSYAYSKK